MNPLAVTRPHPLQLCQRRLRRESHEDIDALPSRANNHQPRALRSRLRRARALSNHNSASTLSHHPPPSSSLTHTQTVHYARQLRATRRHDPPYRRDVLPQDPIARNDAHHDAHQPKARRFLRSLRVRLDARHARRRTEHVPLRARQLAHDRRRLAADRRRA